MTPETELTDRIAVSVCTDAGEPASSVASVASRLAVPHAGLIAFAASRDELASVGAAAATAGLAEEEVAGMTGAGVIGLDGPLAQGVSVLALAQPYRVTVGVADHASADLRAAAQLATSAALSDLGSDAQARLLILLLDPASGDQAHAIAGAYSVAGPRIPLAGGGAGGADTALLAHGTLHTDAVVAIALAAPTAVGMGLGHGTTPCAAPSIVTAARGRMLSTLDGRPAEDVYLEKIGFPIESWPHGGPNDAAFRALAALHPLAQHELSGTVRLRHVLRREHGALECATPVPVDAAVGFVSQTGQAIVESGANAAHIAASAAGNSEERPAAALIFDCAGRKRALGPQLQSSVLAMRESLGQDVPVAGLYTHGEVGRARGARGDRNHAVVIAAIA